MGSFSLVVALQDDDDYDDHQQLMPYAAADEEAKVMVMMVMGRSFSVVSAALADWLRSGVLGLAICGASGLVVHT